MEFGLFCSDSLPNFRLRWSHEAFLFWLGYYSNYWWNIRAHVNYCSEWKTASICHPQQVCTITGRRRPETHFLSNSLISMLSEFTIKWTDGLIFIAVKENKRRSSPSSGFPELYNPTLLSCLCKVKYQWAVLCFSLSSISEEVRENNGWLSGMVDFSKPRQWQQFKWICSSGDFDTAVLAPFLFLSGFL